MQIHVIDPAGERHGPFPNRRAALEFGMKQWPDKHCDDREEDPGAWDIEIKLAD